MPPLAAGTAINRLVKLIVVASSAIVGRVGASTRSWPAVTLTLSKRGQRSRRFDDDALAGGDVGSAAVGGRHERDTVSIGIRRCARRRVMVRVPIPMLPNDVIVNLIRAGRRRRGQGVPKTVGRRGYRC